MTESPLRRAQLIHTFGVGSLYVTNEKVGLITAGLDHWFRDSNDKKEFRINERRLAKRLNVHHFMKPPDYRIPFKSYIQDSNTSNLKIRIPFLRFPQWHYCINRKCSLMTKVQLTEATNKPKCKECGTRIVQAPLVAICQDGHIDDFPWNEYCHKTLTPKCSGENLRFKFQGVPSLSGQSVYCKDCDTRRTLGAALGENISITPQNQNDSSVVFPCNGRRTWLHDHVGESCSNNYQGSLRSSIKVYFSKIASSIYIPEENSNLNPELEEIFQDETWGVLIGLIKQLSDQKIRSNFFRDLSSIDNPVLKNIMEDNNKRLNIKDRLAKFTDDEIDSCLDKFINQDISEKEDETSITEFGTQEEENDYRYKEYKLLLKNYNIKNFETKVMNINDYSNIISRYFKNITLVHKLEETSALYGFTRSKFKENLKLEDSKRKLRLKEVDNFNDTWLPATQTMGEGIFLELDNEIINNWEQKSEVKRRVEIMKDNFMSSLNINIDEEEVADARKIVLHTLSHLLINQLVFDCGYGASSLKERIYSSTKDKNGMSGILIYTVGGDSEGSMGGLVRMGRPGFLETTFRKALAKSSWCSVDPVCSEIGSTTGQGPNSSNLSACHNCALVPETSCEMMNSFLDRTLITGDYNNRSIGLMGEEVKNI